SSSAASHSLQPGIHPHPSTRIDEHLREQACERPRCDCEADEPGEECRLERRAYVEAPRGGADAEPDEARQRVPGDGMAGPVELERDGPVRDLAHRCVAPVPRKAQPDGKLLEMETRARRVANRGPDLIEIEHR